MMELKYLYLLWSIEKIECEGLGHSFAVKVNGLSVAMLKEKVQSIFVGVEGEAVLETNKAS
jgi:hypothetical protein